MPLWRHGKIDVANPDYYVMMSKEQTSPVAANGAVLYESSFVSIVPRVPSVLNVLNQFISRLTPWT